MELISFGPLVWLLCLPILGLFWFYSLVEAPLWKRVASFAFRTLAIILLVIALCRPFAFSSSDQLHVVFLVDVSQSISLDDAEQTLTEIESMIGDLPSGDSWSLMAFGSDIRPFDKVADFKSLLQRWQNSGADDRFRNATPLGESLLKARQSFPAGKSKRIVLFSDGQDTDGFLDESIRQLNDESIDVQFNKMESMSKPEVALLDLQPTTQRAFYGEVVRLTASTTTNRTENAKLRLVHRGVVVQENEVKLEPGPSQRFYFDATMLTPGNSKWTAELVAENDFFTVNNRRTCTIEVRGRPRILILHEDNREMRSIVRALEKQEVDVELRGEFGTPTEIQGMLAFDAIVLADYPATKMTPRQMELLKRYVSDFGGGLAMLGSENSFGLGGYHRTPVEEVLPLVSRFEKEKEKPSLAMVLVIDKSGSMDGVPIALARQAAKAAVELLGQNDQIGVVGFDGQPYIVSEMRSAVQSDAIMSDIDTLDAGGGTNMYPAMVVGKEMLDNASAKIRHMICLSDGHTSPADHSSLAQAMTDAGITVSTVALGDADRQLMANIADIGRGRYYETNDPSNVPQIFTRETMQASKSAIKEDLFGTVKTGDHVALAGFDEAELPFTLGYVMTQSKPTAQVLLVAETGDPLLAVSRFGLGQGMAFTSDWSEKWGGEWLAWDRCGKFWGQVIRSIIRKNDDQGIRVDAQVIKDQWQLSLTRTNDAGRLQPKVNWEVSALDSQGQVNNYSVDEVGLGRYRCQIPIDQIQELTVRVRDRDTDSIKIVNYDRPYPVEYQLDQQMPDEIAKLKPFESQSLREDLTTVQIRKSIAHWFYLGAIVSLLLGNLVRRL